MAEETVEQLKARRAELEDDMCNLGVLIEFAVDQVKTLRVDEYGLGQREGLIAMLEKAQTLSNRCYENYQETEYVKGRVPQ